MSGDSAASVAWWRRPWVQQLGVLALVAGVWAGSFRNTFVYDDVQVIVEGVRIHDPSNLPGFFLNSTMWSAAGGGGGNAFHVTDVDTYRPLTMTTFVWDAAISGREPWSYHLTNLLLHLAVVAVWMGVLRRVRGGAWSPLIAGLALWMGLHPLLAEAHVWINGRSDVLAGLWLGVAVGAYLRGLEASRPAARWGSFAAAGVAFLLGCLCKEVLLLAGPALPLIGWARRPEGAPRWLPAAGALPPALGGLLYLGMRAAALSGLRSGGEPERLVHAGLRAPLLLVDGAWSVLFPTRIWMRNLFEDYRGVEPALLLLGAAGVAAAWAGAWALRRRAPLLLPGVVGWSLTLAPASMITTAVGWWGFNRYLYVPLLLLLPGLLEVLLALGASVRPSVHRGLVVAGAGLLLWSGVGALRVVALYHDPATFAFAMVEGDPERSHGYSALADVLHSQGRLQEARPLMERAVELGPENPRGWNNLAAALLDLGDVKAARQAAAQGWQRWPGNAALCNLTALTWVDEDVPHAAENLLICLRLDPGNADVRVNIRGLLQAHPQRAAYRAAFEELLQRPDYAPLRAAASELL